MLYLLLNSEKQANWQEDYERIYREQLQKNNIDYVEMNLNHPNAAEHILKYMNHYDAVWPMHYKDLMTLPLEQTKAKVLFRMSGTSENPCSYHVNRRDELYALEHVIDINMVFSDEAALYLQSYHPKKKFYATGYPNRIDVAKYAHIKKVKNRIIVGGRLGPDKQFYLATFLLRDAVAAGYEVIFCYPTGDDTDWLKFYGREKFEDKGFKFKELPKHEWLEFLATGDIFFTCPSVEMSGGSCIEAVQLGLYPVVPDIKDGLVNFGSYISDGYEAYAKNSVNYFIFNRPPLKIDNYWFNPDTWGIRFKHMLELEGIKA